MATNSELTCLGQTLRQVENIYWIVAEDALAPTKQGQLDIII